MAIQASDTFTRSNVSGSWGTGTDGKTWVLASSSNSPVLNVTSNEGTSGGAGADAEMLYGSGTLTNGLFLTRFKAGNLSDAIFLNFRSDGTAHNKYRLGVLNGNSAQIVKVVSNAATTLTSTTVSYTTANFYWLKALANGTTLAMKLWQDGTSEPGSYTLSTTDSTFTTAGQYGYHLVSATTTAIQVDSFLVRDLNVVICDGSGGMFS